MKYFPILLLTFLISCEKSITKDSLVLLNGYWEITTVTLANKKQKIYKVNSTIDYLEMVNLKGFKKKLHPKFDGTYSTSNDAESFTLIEKDGMYIFMYKNAFSEWEERLMSLGKDSFSVINQENITYAYKRYKPINVN